MQEIAGMEFEFAERDHDPPLWRLRIYYFSIQRDDRDCAQEERERGRERSTRPSSHLSVLVRYLRDDSGSHSYPPAPPLAHEDSNR
jgi:hypothetical protein